MIIGHHLTHGPAYAAIADRLPLLLMLTNAVPARRPARGAKSAGVPA